MKNHVTRYVLRRTPLSCTCLAIAFSLALGQSAPPTIRRIALLGNEKGLELEITASDPVQADTQVLTGPDRIVVDFPGALPGAELKGLKVNHAGIRAVRAGLFQANPPITRVVIDLETSSQFRLFPSGNTVILKFGSSPTGAIVASIRNDSPFVPLTPGPPKVRVTYQGGLLSIHAQRATLAEVLYEIHERTGADIPIPAGAEQETVVVNAGPAPAKDVLTAVLNGSHFNFVVIGSAQDPNELRSLILTPKLDGSMAVSQPVAPQPVYAAPASPEPEMPAEVPAMGAQQPPPPPPPQPGSAQQAPGPLVPEESLPPDQQEPPN